MGTSGSGGGRVVRGVVIGGVVMVVETGVVVVISGCSSIISGASFPQENSKLLHNPPPLPVVYFTVFWQ
jgi:hypothetical protein